ncbi:MAG TPA: DUF5317 family protein [Gaiellaceae bacterium]|nr:DUF5317 family protein [Gaiellaceae bacterium]
MALVFPILAGLILSLVVGGRLGRIADVRLRSAWLFYAGIAFNVAAFPFRELPWRTPDRLAVGLWLVAYAFLAAGCGRNLRTPGVKLVTVGMASNLAAILANGGHMPALPSALRGAGLHFHVSRNSALAAGPHLSWLVDRWAAPAWVPLANVYSVGDVLISVGGFVFAFVASGGWARLRSVVRGAGADPVEPPLAEL